MQIGLFNPLITETGRKPHIEHVPIEISDIEMMPEVREIPEMHDRLIAITALRIDTILLSRDRNILQSSKVTCLW